LSPLASKYIVEATQLLESKIHALMQLSYEQASALPGTEEVNLLIANEKASLTTFRQANASRLDGEFLVVVLAAKPRHLGLSSTHIERGLVFSIKGPARQATEQELQSTGG
jgi:hypothetical protein